jgi:hypothetical protein
VIAEAALAAVLMATPPKSPRPPAACTDKTALMLWHAGFKGHKNRIAWAVVYRESKGQNLDESSRFYTGALGVFQVQTSAHRHKAWWSRSAMLHPPTQSRIVYRHMTNRGTYWRPWGLNSSGTAMDTSHFRRWSSWQHWNWIWVPYQRGLALYPKACAR